MVNACLRRRILFARSTGGTTAHARNRPPILSPDIRPVLTQYFGVHSARKQRVRLAQLKLVHGSIGSLGEMQRRVYATGEGLMWQPTRRRLWPSSAQTWNGMEWCNAAWRRCRVFKLCSHYALGDLNETRRAMWRFDEDSVRLSIIREAKLYNKGINFIKFYCSTSTVSHRYFKRFVGALFAC